MITMVSFGTQTDLNLEIVLNFIANDLPRVVSLELVPHIIHMLSTPELYQDLNLNHIIQLQIKEVIQSILVKTMPYWEEIKESLPIENKFIELPKLFKPPAKTKKRPAASSIPTLKPLCELCKLECMTFIELCTHYNQEHSDKPEPGTPLQCPMCQFSACKVKEFVNHIEKMHIYANGKQRRRQVSSRTCGWGGWCDAEFTAKSAFIEHRKEHKIPTCPKCHVIFEFESQLTSHVRNSISCGVSLADSTLPTPPITTSQNSIPPSTPNPQNATAAQSNAAASMVGHALLAALALTPSKPDQRSGDLGSSIIGVKSEPGIPTLVPSIPDPVAFIEESLVMDTETGIPIPVSKFVEKRKADKAAGAGAGSKPPPPKVAPGRQLRCHFCNKSFKSRNVLHTHVEKYHLQKKTISCTKCHRLFATMQEVDSHFNRVHRTNDNQFQNGKTPRARQSENITPPNQSTDQSKNAKSSNKKQKIKAKPKPSSALSDNGVSAPDGTVTAFIIEDKIDIKDEMNESPFFVTSSAEFVETDHESENDTEKKEKESGDEENESRNKKEQESDFKIKAGRADLQTRSGRKTKAPRDYAFGV